MVNELRKISIDAGLEILDIYHSDEFGVEIKGDDSPLTKADLASHNIIVKGLKEINQQYGFDHPILSEESKTAEYNTRENWDKFWLIDPLDGTKEFIKRNGEFTVNIALIEAGVPVIGFVYAPVLDVLYYGIENKAYKIMDASDANSKPVKLISSKKDIDSIKIVASKSHLNDETKIIINKVKEQFDSYDFCSYGSSLKLCKVADGSADFYPRIAPTMEWDTAASDAVCRSAGFSVLSVVDHKPLRYNKEKLLNPYFYVTANEKIKKIMESV